MHLLRFVQIVAFRPNCCVSSRTVDARRDGSDHVITSLSHVDFKLQLYVIDCISLLMDRFLKKRPIDGGCPSSSKQPSSKKAKQGNVSAAQRARLGNMLAGNSMRVVASYSVVPVTWW